MPHEIHVTLSGVLFASLFIAAIGGLFRWMFSVPRPLPVSPVVSEGPPGIGRKILVPTSGSLCLEQGIDLACTLGREEKAEIHLVNVIEVPLTLPLGAILPEAEVEAEGIIRRGEAIVNQRGLKAKGKIRRGRMADEEIIKVAEGERVDMIVMGIQPRTRMIQKILGCTSDRVWRQAACDVILGLFPRTKECRI